MPNSVKAWSHSLETGEPYTVSFSPISYLIAQTLRHLFDSRSSTGVEGTTASGDGCLGEHCPSGTPRARFEAGSGPVPMLTTSSTCAPLFLFLLSLFS